ncbi:MAG: hypothetical protein MSQ05_02455 [Akkermansia sp.]|nr:hypothetical protein [Akkermansia sp.]
MKNFPVKLFCVVSLLAVVISLFSSADEEKDTCQNPEYKTVCILPIYRNSASIEEVYTTEPCAYKWNGEAFSHVWPQTREELMRHILELRECKKSIHNFHVIAILDSAEKATFRKNLDHLYESIIISELLDFPLVVSIGTQDTYTTISPSHIGPDYHMFTIHDDYVLHTFDGVDKIYGFDEAKQTLVEQLSKKTENYFLLKWIPSPSNVDFLLYVLKKLESYNSEYEFEIAFPEV